MYIHCTFGKKTKDRIHRKVCTIQIYTTRNEQFVVLLPILTLKGSRLDPVSFQLSLVGFFLKKEKKIDRINSTQFFPLPHSAFSQKLVSFDVIYHRTTLKRY